jgi:alkanesulfonate monooxygenase SsuD/methylene tetrahydromethanopterin reductase-like flavin-dependent oxidoreductase (luciferase family)
MGEGFKKKEYIQAVNERYSPGAIRKRLIVLQEGNIGDRIDSALNNKGMGFDLLFNLIENTNEEDRERIASLLAAIALEFDGGNELGIKQSMDEFARYVRKLWDA